MAVPTWITGQVLAASDVNTWFVPLAVVKPSDQSVTSSTVLVNDTALALPLLANRTYEFDLTVFWLPVNSSTTPGLSYQLNAPAGATGDFAAIVPAAGATVVSPLNNLQTNFPSSGTGSSTFSPLWLHGVVIMSGTAGNLQFQFAQNLSSATSTTVKANSFFVARAIA